MACVSTGVTNNISDASVPLSATVSHDGGATMHNAGAFEPLKLNGMQSLSMLLI